VEYRITLSYAHAAGERPTEAALERLRVRLSEALPDADARVAESAFTVDVAVTVRAERELDAINRAVSAADAVVGDASIRSSAQPVPLPAKRED
jgi:hypothetical protein